MLVPFAFALLAAAEPANLLEPSLAKACGKEVLNHARIWTNGDSRTLIYDNRLPPEQTRCLLTWAESWRGQLVNGVNTYASPRYPLGPYDISPELRRRR